MEKTEPPGQSSTGGMPLRSGPDGKDDRGGVRSGGGGPQVEEPAHRVDADGRASCVAPRPSKAATSRPPTQTRQGRRHVTKEWTAGGGACAQGRRRRPRYRRGAQNVGGRGADSAAAETSGVPSRRGRATTSGGSNRAQGPRRLPGERHGSGAVGSRDSSGCGSGGVGGRELIDRVHHRRTGPLASASARSFQS